MGSQIYLPHMKINIYLPLVFLWIAACQSSTHSIDIQGHRGARGHLPENTLPAFLLAIEQGATTLELDLALTADTQLVISHEPWMSPEICLDSNQNKLKNRSKSEYNIFHMPYSNVKTFDCGTLNPKQFPHQKSLVLPKPLLSELLDTLLNLPHPIAINAEIKSKPQWDSLYYPNTTFLVDHLLNVLNQYNYTQYSTIQSFDPRPLNYLGESSTLKIALLVDQNENPYDKLRQLHFTPDILSPHHLLVDKKLRDHTKRQDIHLIPWTVNDTKRMKQLIKLKVDGIITDYPDRLASILD